MITSKVMTPTNFYISHKTESLSGIEGQGEAGTFNSVVCTAGENTTTYAVNNRWEIMQLFNGFNDAAYWNFHMPSEHIDASDIKVIISWVSNATSGNININVGLSVSTGEGVMGGESDTQYQNSIINVPATDDTITNTEFTFKSDVVGDTAVSIVVYRPDVASPDTAAGNLKIGNVEVEFSVRSSGT